jgi:restriction system protein
MHRDRALTQEKRKVTLLDLEKLYDLWAGYCSKVSESGKRLFPLKPVHCLAP